MRALITGINGSGASYLAEYIAAEQPAVEIHGLARWHGASGSDNLGAVRDLVSLWECDLMDMGSILRCLDKSAPDIIFHLASFANVRASFDTPLAVLQNNVFGTANLLEAVRITGRLPTIVLCSTSEVYGKVEAKDVPITEDCPMRPVNPYAVSKAAQDMLGYSYYLNYGLPVVRTRMFTYVNPRRKDLFVAAFAMQVAEVEAGRRKVLRHGNLDSVRVLLDVRDAARAYWLAGTKCVPGAIYNIGGTMKASVRDVLKWLMEMASVPIATELDESLIRPTDVTMQIACSDKFTLQTGWRPRYDPKESIANLLEHCRKEIKWG